MSKKDSPIRFALAIVGFVALATAALGFFAWRNPVALGTWIARSGLENVGLERAEVEGPRGPLTYFQGGQGRQTLVLVHDLGQQAGTWLKVVDDLSQRYRLVVVDLAGHGDSDPEHGAVGLDDLLAGLEAVLDSAAAGSGPAAASRSGGRPILVGNGFGGWVAARYALAHPEGLERLVLVSANGLGGGMLVEAHLPADRAEAAAWVRALGPENARIPAGFVLDDLVRRSGRGPTSSILSSLRPEHDLAARLGELALPVELIWGLEGRVVPPEVGRRFEVGLPDARFHGLEGCGHLPQQQCPAELVSTLVEALDAPRE